MKPDTQNVKHYSYIFVREDLTTSQQAVQCCHAAINATAKYGLGDLPDHPYLVILAVKNESKLLRVQKYLSEHGIQFSSFHESDLDNELTAIATEPIKEHQRAIFRKYQCLKPREAA